MEEKILLKLQELLRDVATVTRRPNKIGSVGGDSEKRFSFDIKWFIDWEIQKNKNEKGSILDNMDYWMPKIRETYPKCESHFHNSNEATIWINKKQIEEQDKLTVKIPLNFMNTAITIDNFFVADTNNSEDFDILKFPLPEGKWSIYSHAVQKGEVVLVKN